MINFSVTDQASTPNTTTITGTSNTNKVHIVGIVSNETNTMTMYLNNQQLTSISVNPLFNNGKIEVRKAASIIMP